MAETVPAEGRWCRIDWCGCQEATSPLNRTGGHGRGVGKAFDGRASWRLGLNIGFEGQAWLRRPMGGVSIFPLSSRGDQAVSQEGQFSRYFGMIVATILSL